MAIRTTQGILLVLACPNMGGSPRRCDSMWAFSLSRPTCILTVVYRTRPIHPPSPATVVTKRVGHTRPRPARVSTAVPRNCERLGEVLVFFFPMGCLLSGLDFYSIIILSSTPFTAWAIGVTLLTATAPRGFRPSPVAGSLVYLISTNADIRLF